MIDQYQPTYQEMCAYTPLAVICPTCQARPVQPCRTDRGKVCLPHPGRSEAEVDLRPKSLDTEPSLLLWVRVEIRARAGERFVGGYWAREALRCDVDEHKVLLRVQPGGQALTVEVDDEAIGEIAAEDARPGIARLLDALDLTDGGAA